MHLDYLHFRKCTLWPFYWFFHQLWIKILHIQGVGLHIWESSWGSILWPKIQESIVHLFGVKCTFVKMQVVKMYIFKIWGVKCTWPIIQGGKLQLTLKITYLYSIIIRSYMSFYYNTYFLSSYFLFIQIYVSSFFFF